MALEIDGGDTSMEIHLELITNEIQSFRIMQKSCTTKINFSFFPYKLRLSGSASINNKALDWRSLA